MEDELDAISRGELDHVDYLRTFYFGNGTSGPEAAAGEQGRRDRRPRRQPHSRSASPSGRATERSFVRVGRYGPFLEQGERRASLPDDMPPDELTLATALEMLDQAGAGRRAAGHLPRHAQAGVLKVGRFGPYVQRGTPEDDENQRTPRSCRSMKPADVTLELALKLLSLPRTLGEHPQTDEPVVAHNGRFGPYVKAGSETRSLPRELSPLDVTLEQALELLAQPKARGRGRAAPGSRSRRSSASPVTNQPVKLLEGRYGPYVTDGTTNASLPKGLAVDQLTFDEALNLLGERAARGPSTKSRRGRAAKRVAAPKAARKTKAAVMAKDKPSQPPKKAAKRSGRNTSAEA